ncbi:MAG: tetratricopeptide repeat protein [Deltaproteobacteria bacterium]|nr:tetratricopeptide repeat protein [Deltaproteobacteria bacterium]
MNFSDTGFKTLKNSELEFLERLALTDPSSPDLLSLARVYLAQKRFESGAKVARGVVDAHPDNLEAALVLAQAYVRLDQVERAKGLLKKASSRLTDLIPIFKELSRLFEITGESNQSLRFLKVYKALALSEEAGAEGLLFELDPLAEEAADRTEPVPTETLAGLYLEQGLVDKALEIYEKILEEDPENEMVRSKMVDIYLGVNQCQQSRIKPDKLRSG